MTTHSKKIAGFLLAIMALAAIVLAVQIPSASADAGSLIESGITTAAGDSYEDISLGTFAGNVIAALLSATGIIFVVMMVYAGVLYMTAAGDENKIKKAKSMIVTSLIGIIVVVGAYAFTTFVVEELGDAATSTEAQTSE